MKSSHLKWLYRELPDLISRGILPEESASRLREHYGPVGDEDSRRRLALLIFGVFGAALIGTGILLLVAHNWDELSRPTRAAVAIGLLLFAQALTGWVVWRQPESIVLREAVSTFLFTAVGTCIALISQTYNIPGDLDRFLLVWMLLMLPVILLLRVRIPAAFYLGGITWWSFAAEDGWRPFFWLLVALLLPLLVKPSAGRTTRFLNGVLLWTAAPALALSGFAMIPVLETPWIVYLVTLLAALYAVGLQTLSGEAYRSPFVVVGLSGVALCSLFLTFEGLWQWQYREYNLESAAIALSVFGLALTVFALWTGYRMVRRGEWAPALVCVSPLVAGTAYLLVGTATGIVGALVFNIYFFALGLLMLIGGLREGALSSANVGLLMLTALFVARFFDVDVSLLVRGFAFIGIGLAFLFMNSRLLSRKKEA